MTSSAPRSAQQIIDILGLAPLEHEGGLFRQTYVDSRSTAIYYLLTRGDFSALHRLTGPEVYHFYAGSPLQLLILHPDGRAEEPVVGTDLAAGQRPQMVVPGGSWHGSSSMGEWTLVGTTMAPPFEWTAFTVGDRSELVARYPAVAGRIAALTRG